MASSNVCTDCIPPDSHQPPTYNPTDPSTFVPPTPGAPHCVVIEFCHRCRWLHRATWTSTELFVTFPPPALQSITIVPLDAEDTVGRFRIWLRMNEDAPPILVWDRKVEGHFPELKDLKQRIRDHIQPGRSLGHSDK
ncbi:Rdx family-domain-containing protein [Russula earlei]|uniref:Rdx family-domain-containing protein n=1 Tax=Russula earlei TaxID=71964 RepID=A0ACC0UFR6_9AGAM|nr:Rdx family-domain-containing protein [Russula earlei]